MGFLDKISAAAKDAKQALDKTGLVDQLKEQVKGATGVGDDNAGQQQASEPQPDWSTATRTAMFGLPNPWTLLTTEDMKSITSVDLSPPADTGAENMYGVRWIGRVKRDEYSFSLSVMVWNYEDVHHHTVEDGVETMAELRSVYEAADVPGLGDDAFGSEDLLYVRKGAVVLLAEASGPKGYDSGPTTLRMAQTAVSRLP